MALFDVPLSGQSLLQTRQPIQNNFSVISTAFEVDHVGYNISGQGWHNKVTFVPQASGPTTSSSNVALYSKTVNSVTQLFYRGVSSGTEINFTESLLESPGWTRLPSGLLVKWGQTSGNPFGLTPTATITFPMVSGMNNIPAFTTILGVIPILLNTSGGTVESRALNLTASSNTSFTVTLTGGSQAANNTNIMWLAWGIGN